MMRHQAVEALNSLPDYDAHPDPSVVDRAVENALRSYTALDSRNRTGVAGNIDEASKDSLLRYALRAADVLSAPDGAQTLKFAVLALGLARSEADVRTALVARMLYARARFLGLPPEDALLDAASDADPETYAYLKLQIDRLGPQRPGAGLEDLLDLLSTPVNLGTEAVRHMLLTQGSGPYGRAAIPCPRDAAITEVVDRFVAAPPEIRGRVATELGADQLASLLVYSPRAAALSVRSHDPRETRASLVSVGMALYAAEQSPMDIDVRDVMVYLPVPYDSARRVGVDPVALFEWASQLFSGVARNEILDFAYRNEDDKSLGAFEWNAGHDGRGFIYTSPW